MDKKIGRNEPCTCGSGIKYKKCCFLKQRNQSKTNNKKENKDQIFNSFNSLDLALTFAALSLNPENHGKLLRLDYFTFKSLQGKNYGSPFVNISLLENSLTNNYSYYSQEDPPENVFTENITSSIGNSIIYCGNFYQGAFTLRNQLKAFNYYRNDLPNPFLKQVKDASQLLLFLSNIIAKGIGHTRNMKGKYYEAANEILFQSNIEEVKPNLIFPFELINKFCKLHRIDSSILTNFELNPDALNLQVSLEENETPLCLRPLIRKDDNIFVVSPSNLIVALQCFIWSKAKEFDCMEMFVNAFHEIIIKELKNHLRQKRFVEVPNPLEKFNSKQREFLLYKFDLDKIAVFEITKDLGEGYQSESINQNDLTSSSGTLRQKEIAECVLKTYPQMQLQFFELYSSIGRNRLVMLERASHPTINTTIYNFITCLKQNKVERLTFWYYCKALKNLEKETTVMPMTGFPELFPLYLKNNSFYLGDGKKPNMLVPPFGVLTELMYEASKLEDPIVALSKVDGFDFPVYKSLIKVQHFPIAYGDIENAPKRPEMLLDEFPLSMWVSANMTRDQIEFLPKFSKYLDAFLYWISELKPFLVGNLEKISQPYLYFKFGFDTLKHPEISDVLPGIDVSETLSKFEIFVDKNSIELLIPSDFDLLLYNKKDNSHESFLIHKIIDSFNEFFIQFENTDPLNAQDIISQIAPIGLKKMIHFISTDDNLSLDPRNTNGVRFIQEDSLQLLMDQIVPLLGSQCPSIGEIETKQDKIRFTKDIVISVLLPLLKTKLSKINSNDLLKDLIQLNEDFIHNNATFKLRLPSRIESFQNLENTHEEIIESTKKRDKTTLAVRCLIEHCAAESTCGTDVISDEIKDELISIMSLIIFWGGVGDKIKYDLFDIKLSILESGRIGTNTEEIVGNFFDNFSQKKSNEMIEDVKVKYFYNDPLKEKNDPNVYKRLDEIFQNDYGVSWTKITEFILTLVYYSFEKVKSGVSKLNVSEILTVVNEGNDCVFNQEEINSILEFLCLKNRGSITNLPEGLTNNDVSPWRYNRRLSYLQKPIILLEEGQESYIIWTPRHLKQSWNYITELIFSARLKVPEESKLFNYLGKLANQKGKDFQKFVRKKIEMLSHDFIDEEIKISPKSTLKSTSNLGDIDILYINRKHKIVFSIECKKTEPARNSTEMIEEVRYYLHPEKGYVHKHLKRHNWLVTNKKNLSSVVGFNVEEFEIISLFITNETLPIRHMTNRKLHLPFIDIYELKDKNITDLLEILNERKN